MAVQVSGAFGSRQEAAQRLGRVLRPKDDGRQAWLYSLVGRDTTDTTDVDFAARRQRFLAEQGYGYEIVDADALDQGCRERCVPGCPARPCGVLRGPERLRTAGWSGRAGRCYLC